jgi:hypothetical protein
MKSLPPNPPNGFGGRPDPPRGGPSPGPVGSYLAPGGACGSNPNSPRPCPPNRGSSNVGCIPPVPGPPLNPPPPTNEPRSGSCGPSPGGFKSSPPIPNGEPAPGNGGAMPRSGRLRSYSSSKPGGANPPSGRGRRGPAASGSSKGYGRAGCGSGSRRGLGGGLRLLLISDSRSV